MNVRRAMISGVVLLVVGLGASEARAQGMGRGRGGDRAFMGHLKSLNLTAPQLQQISQLRADMLAKTAPARAQLQVKHAELRTLWLAKSPSRAAIIAKHNEIDTLERQLRNARIDLRLNVFKVLTPQQRSQLQAGLAAGPRGGKGWGRGPGKGRGRGRGPGPGPGAGGQAL